MSKIKLSLFVFTISLVLTGCNLSINNNNDIPSSTEDMIDNQYTGSFYKGNYVYGAAMNLAWNELVESFTKGPVILNTEEEKALETTDKFNNSIFTKNDLDEESYYVKSGFGQETVNTINRESKEKFPSKTFADLDLTLRDVDFISYAYFLKEVEYPLAFKETEVKFNKERVKGFYADSDEQKDGVGIVHYWDDDKFIVKLKLKDYSDELFLAKGLDMSDPEEVVKYINKYNKDAVLMSYHDHFEMPKLHLEQNRHYNEVIGKYLLNPGLEEYKFGIMYENIKFDLDETGARVENEAVIGMLLGSAMNSQKVEVKNLILDKPFWVVMKRKASENPYFILGVNNTELMELK